MYAEAAAVSENLNKTTGKESFESVHLVNFPKVEYHDEELEQKMDIAQRVVYLTRSMRAKNNLKVRQPLKKILVSVAPSKRDAVAQMKDVILEEVNIKELQVLEDDSAIVNKSAKANFKSLGPKYGKLMKTLAAEIAKFGKDDIAKLEKENELNISIDGEDIQLTLDDVEIISTEIEGWLVESEEGVTVGIDTELTDELIAEGYAREFVNRVQNMRKDADFDVVDKIKIYYESDEKLIKYIGKFSEYIKSETLADELASKPSNNGYSEEWEIGDYKCKISIVKAG
jgi:isoleucyl-tRNA synthetase